MLSQGEKGECGAFTHIQGQARHAGLISVTAGAEVPTLWNIGNPVDLVMGFVVVTFVICTFMCVLQF